MELKCEDGTCETGEVRGNQIQIVDNRKDTLLYFGDPMCSWCWGITNNLDKIKDQYADRFDFELVLGGLRPGGGEAWTPAFREMIKGHWQHVQKASGQPFDYAFFDREVFNYDTEPPARAVRVVRDLAPEKEWGFYKALQRLFYAENKDISDVAILKEQCGQMGIDAKRFETLFASAGYKQLVKQDFIKAQQFGISGFPTVVLKKGEEYYAVCRGYSAYEQMKANIESILVAQ